MLRYHRLRAKDQGIGARNKDPRRASSGCSVTAGTGRQGRCLTTLVSFRELGKGKPDQRQVEKLEAVLGSITRDEQLDEQPLAALSAWLSKALAKKNVTPNELARKSGISPATIYNLLNGSARNPQQRTLKRLESALGAPAVLQ
jgi:DNA-binding Xre family transcriptional regulator